MSGAHHRLTTRLQSSHHAPSSRVEQGLRLGIVAADGLDSCQQEKQCRIGR